MPRSMSIATPRSFLGLVSYHGTFLPDRQRLRAPTNHPLEKNTKRGWSVNCQASFEKIKKLLASNLLPVHYDPFLLIVVSSDASKYRV